MERASDNLLVLDYCDIESRGRSARDLPVIHADHLNWQWQGLDGTPWRGHQYNRTVCDMAFPAESELVIRYTFWLAAELPRAAREGLRIAIERPWLYAIQLNDTPINPDTGARWFDEEMRAFAIGARVRPGENTLCLRAAPFSVFCEIAPVIVIGDFALDARERGFVVNAARPLTLGDWTRQGMLFYHQTVRYRCAFTSMQPARALRVRLPHSCGALATALLDGREAGTILHPPHELDVDGDLPPGRHELELAVIGTMKNFMGPHFSDGLAGPWTWSVCPPHQPPGSQYRFSPAGLTDVPELAVMM